jgi:hypothetical protein
MLAALIEGSVHIHGVLNTNILSRATDGVTNNTTRVRIGYRIYSLWRLQLHMVTVTMNTIALVASRVH